MLHARNVLLPAQYPELARLPAGWSLLRYMTAAATNNVVVLERAQVGRLEARIDRLQGALEHVQGKQDREVEIEGEEETEEQKLRRR